MSDEHEPQDESPSPIDDADQLRLFGDGEWWESEWKGMPEFIQNDLEPFKTINVHFENKKDVEAFAKLVGQTITMNTRAIWYPPTEILSKLDRRYVSEGAERRRLELPGKSADAQINDDVKRTVTSEIDFDSWSSLPPPR
jgi:hypothetical protein